VTRWKPAESVHSSVDFDFPLAANWLRLILPDDANPARFSKIEPKNCRLRVLAFDGLGVKSRKFAGVIENFSRDKSFHRFPFLFELAGKRDSIESESSSRLTEIPIYQFIFRTNRSAKTIRQKDRSGPIGA
jgi:hypothetical protein